MADVITTSEPLWKTAAFEKLVDEINSDIYRHSGVTGASTTAGRPFTADEINAAVEAVTRMTTLKAAPTWVSTSVTWLEQKHSHYVMSSGVVHPIDRLTHALRRMSFGMLEIERANKGQSAEMLRALHDDFLRKKVAAWSELEHSELRDFISSGGYKAAKELADFEDLAAEEAAEPPAKPKKGKKKPAEDKPEPTIENTLAALTSPQQEQSLDEVVERELLEDDPRFGAW